MARSKPLAMHLLNVAGKTEDGRNVYHCLRWCNRVRREFLFTLKPAGVSGERRGVMRWQFDARELPSKYRDARTDPICWVLSALNDGWEPADEPKRKYVLPADIEPPPF